MSDSTHHILKEFPGGEETIDLIVDFCYSVPVVSRLTVENIGHVMCAADFLRMTAVTAQCTKKLTKLTEVGVANCTKILSNCVDVIPNAESSGVVDHCINALAVLGKIHGFDTSPGVPGVAGVLRAFHRRRFLLTDEYVITNGILTSWIGEMSHLPVAWAGRSILALKTKCPTLEELPSILAQVFLQIFCSQNSLSGPDFVLLLKAQEGSPTSSLDLAFKVFEKILQVADGACRLTEGEIVDIMEHLDFTRISQEGLERAAKNDCIPHKATLAAAVSVCSQLRRELQTKR